MKERFRIVGFIGSIVFSTLLIFLFLYLRSKLLFSPLDPSIPGLDVISLIIILGYIWIGCYHLYLFFYLLKHTPSLQSNLWKYAIAFVFVLLSGILLISDATILMDIGKEYQNFDVSSEWILMFGLMGFHILTLLFSYYFTTQLQANRTRLFDSIQSGNNQMFVLTYQIMSICGVAGILLTGMYFLGGWNLIALQHRVGFILTSSVLLGLPLITFGGFWFMKFHKKPFIKWLDEHEWYLTTMGMSISLIIGWIIMAIGIGISGFIDGFSTIIWFLLCVFIQIEVLAIYVLFQSHME